MKERTLQFLRTLKEHMECYNNLAPFPLFDTEYVADVKRMIMNLEKRKEYDNIPVVACKYCKSLYIMNDDLENDVCARCGSINDIEFYSNIEEYLKSKNNEE